MRFIALVLLLMLLIPVPSYAQPPVCYFFGVVKIGGEDAPSGTKVEAYIGGKKVKEALTKGSEYTLKITQPEGESYSGKEVIFKVNGKLADKGAIWEAGGVIRVDLNVPLKVPPETPTAPPVCFFSGRVYINGDTVTDGTEVVAYINDEEVGRCEASGSTYFMKITQPEGKVFEGEEVIFKVAGYEAPERGIWEMGETKELDINAKTPSGLVAIFYGSVKIDDEDVEDGTRVSAYIGGELAGTCETLNSKYMLKIIQPTNRNYEGKKISFKIGEFEANEESIWSVGTNVMLNLTAKIGASVHIEVSKEKVVREEGLTVYVVIESKEKITSFEFELEFSPIAFEFVDIKAGDFMGKGIVEKFEKVKPGLIRYAVARAGVPEALKEGKLAIIKLKVKRNAPEGRYELSVKKISLSGEEFKPVKNIILKKIYVEVLSLKRGDIDRDGRVDYRDLAILRSAYGSKRGEKGFNPYADLMEDGVIDYKDLAVLGRNYED